ncbi:TolB family protein [Flavisolibacter nicotianae]|uniref:TolB family protein n=1 Tax=Flavisolibacter nicotianae TaxID=2364882 RepID=UPI000EAD6E48|nr:PD40 domain-containing protein [Flavisolibacter nicotianae]
MKILLAAFPVLCSILCSVSSPVVHVRPGQTDTVHYPEETHFRNVQQLTFGGDNAEAYWSYDGKSLVFQRTSVKDGIPCDQIFYGKVPAPGEPFVYKRISSGKGRTTCPFFTKDNRHIIYASTHENADTCPPLPDRSRYGNKYIWPVYSSYDIYMADLEGKIVRKLTDTPGYDAEATLSPDGKKMLFTSMRNGDLDLYVMDLQNGKVVQVTNTPGYDGGAWFSRDGKKILWRASRPQSEAELTEYKALLKDGLVAPTQMELFIANADGSDARQITSLGQANWAPNFLPDGNVIFCSNHEYKRGFPFNMYTLHAEGTHLQKISHDKSFDAFPMFSPDGKRIVFCSNRNNGGTRDTNIFVADYNE